MKSFNWKSLIPHMVAVGIFLLVALIFCSPALQGNVTMVQGDMTGTQGMTHQSFEYQKLHGTLPLWTTNMFGGMPAFQTIFEGPFNPVSIIDHLFQLWLPKPINYFFLLSLGFYFLTVCLNVRTWVGVITSLAYAYSLYDPIIAAVGHQTKILAMAYAPAVLGAIILIFEKKYLWGFILAAFFSALHLQQNHTQISYYLLIVILVMSLFYLARWIKSKDFRHLGIVVGLGAVAAVIGVMVNAVTLLPVIDYAKETKRGGQLVMDNRIDSKTNEVRNNKTSGLSKEYAFQWSYGKAESMSLMFPGVMGYGFHAASRDDESRVFPQLGEKSHVAKFLAEKIGEDQANNIAAQLSGNLYWGDQPFTAGPVYLGAVVCFLFIFGMFYLDDKHKWWILIASAIGIMLAMGSHLAWFNNFIFDHLPGYNKFRAPTQSLVIPQLLFPMLGALALNKLLENQNDASWNKLRLSAMATGAIFAIAAIMYFSFDFSKENVARTNAFNLAISNPASEADMQAKMAEVNQKYQPEADNQLYENFFAQTKGDRQIAKGVITALRDDRAAVFGRDILRSLAFVALTLLLMGLFIKKRINERVMLAGIGLLILIDLLSLGFNYINRTNFINKDEYEGNQFPVTAADEQILKDKDPNYRVLNLTGNFSEESRTSYFHKSIGGYHPAKLGIYDDLISYQLSGKVNEPVLNMLNTKYVIQQDPQGKQPMAFPNQGALGNAWFVKAVKFVNGPVEEMKALDQFNPKDTAIIDNSYKAAMGPFTASDSASTIKQTSFDNDAIKYESNSAAPKLAVFSEIFYKDWKAYIDGSPAKIIKANYVLRALVVPVGKHVIDFKFEPQAYKTGSLLTSIASWLLVLLILIYGALVFFGKDKILRLNNTGDLSKKQ